MILRLGLFIKNLFENENIINFNNNFNKNNQNDLITKIIQFNPKSEYSNIKKKKKPFKIDPNIFIGIRSNLAVEDFRMLKFAIPTLPIAYSSRNEIIKYKLKRNIYTNIETPTFSKKNDNEEIGLIQWLYELKMFKVSNYKLYNLPKLCSDGIFLSNLINNLENDEKIKGIVNPAIKENQKMINITKVLNYLKTIEKFNKQYLFDSEKFKNNDFDAVIGLLSDIKIFYQKKRFKRKYSNTKKVKSPTILEINESYDNFNLVRKHNNFFNKYNTSKNINTSLRNINHNIRLIKNNYHKTKNNNSFSIIYTDPNFSYDSDYEMKYTFLHNTLKDWLISIGLDSELVNKLDFNNEMKEFKDGYNLSNKVCYQDI